MDVVNATLIDFELGQWIPDLANPSPWVMRNGTVLIMVHSAGTGGGGPVILRSTQGGPSGEQACSFTSRHPSL
jgi:hypothetical protein